MACSTVPYCLGVWRDARCTPCAVRTLSATRKPAQHCMQHPRPVCIRPWREASSPKVALPPRPWDDQRRRTVWECTGAPCPALLKFLPSGLLRRSRCATPTAVVAPLARAGLSPRVALPSGPWPVLRRRTAWACCGTPNAPRLLSRPSLLPASPHSTACNTRGRSCAERGFGPSALGLRCHRAHGTANWTKLVGHPNGYQHQPRSSFYAPAPSARRLRSATSKTVVAPMALAGLSPRVALPSGPWPALRCRTTWACGGMPDAPRVRSRPSLLPASPRSTACNTQGPWLCIRPWREAFSPKVALPPRPWDD